MIRALTSILVGIVLFYLALESLETKKQLRACRSNYARLLDTLQTANGTNAACIDNAKKIHANFQKTLRLARGCSP